MMRFLMATALLLATASCASAQGLQPNTSWENSRGSELTIVGIAADGSLKGTYINKAPGFGCQNTPFPVIGWVDGEKLSFSVRWKSAAEDCKSITSWTGYHSKNRILTDWDLVYLDAGEGHHLIYKGSDHFKKK